MMFHKAPKNTVSALTGDTVRGTTTGRALHRAVVLSLLVWGMGQVAIVIFDLGQLPAPQVDASISVTNTPAYVFSGTKAPGTAIWINGLEAVPVDDKPTWITVQPTQEGVNTFALTARNSAGKTSTPVTRHVELDSTPPPMPLVDIPPELTNLESQRLTGTKTSGSLVWINGKLAKVAFAATTWVADVKLEKGENQLAVTAQDALGNESPAYTVVVYLDNQAPPSPMVGSFEPVFNKTTQVITGAKEPGSDIWINGRQVVLPDDKDYWSASLNHPLEQEYAFSLVSTDKAGNQSEMVGINVRHDRTPTASAGKPRVGLSWGQVDLAWNNPPDKDLAGVLVLHSTLRHAKSPKDPTQKVIYKGKTNALVDADAVTGRPNYYSIYTYDKALNFSAVATRVSVVAGLPGELDQSFSSPTGVAAHDNAAGGEGHDFGFSTAIDMDGRILVAGESNNTQGGYDMTLWRYTAHGVLDTTFGAEGLVNDQVSAIGSSSGMGQAVAVDTDGRVLVTGYSGDPTRKQDMALWRFTPDGVLDTEFGEGGLVTHHGAAGGDDMDFGASLALDASGRILVAGYSKNANGDFDMTLWRYDEHGQLDVTFGDDANGDGFADGFVLHRNAAGGGGDDQGHGLALDDAGNILVVGYSTSPEGDLDMAVWRFTDVGISDPTFGGDYDKDGAPDGYLLDHSAAFGRSDDEGLAVTVAADGSLLVTGNSEGEGKEKTMVLWRVTPEGMLDHSFGWDYDRNGAPDGYILHDNRKLGPSNGYALTQDSKGNVLVAGETGRIEGSEVRWQATLWRFMPNGLPDATFGVDNEGDGLGDGLGNGFSTLSGLAPRMDSSGRAISLNAKGRIVMAGFLGYSSNYDLMLSRHLP